jgi:ribonuclease BN (tRNA processing enzyme)
VKLTIIGSSGTYPGPASACASYLLEDEGFRLLLDMGNGSIGALQQACGLLGPDALVVSHLHGDHYLDLITYTYARRYNPAGAARMLPVYGPSKIRETIHGAYGHDVSELLDTVYDIHAVDRDQTLSIGPFEVDMRRVTHTVETYGMRIRGAAGGTLAYSADTGACDTLVGLAKDADLFLCEASYLDGDDNPTGIHLTGREAAEFATRADAKRLVLTHLVPWGDEARTLAEADARYAGEIQVARPLNSFDV